MAPQILGSVVAQPAGGVPLGQMLVDAGLLSPEQLNEALKEQDGTSTRLGEILIRQNVVNPRDLTRVLSDHLGVPVVDLRAARSNDDALELISEAYAHQHVVLPLMVDGNRLMVAVADPTDLPMLAELRVMTRREIGVALAAPGEIEDAIRQRYRVLPGVNDLVKAFQQQDRRTGAISADAAILAENAPLVQIVNLLITQGLRDRASDIHIEPKKDHIRIRFRIDGVLTDVLTLPIALAAAMASRIKIMAELDIVERHRSQDGQIQLTIEDRPVDIRVSTVETIWGEKVVLRLLDKARTILQLHELGCADVQYQQLKGLLRSPFGMIIVSGPTGSGKTTTLYAAVNELDAVGRNITTIEDPVEYTFEDLNQVQIRKFAQITFANGLKAILRQDPDVILVGEIRDLETAEIAVQSALTGHLVLSSLHATDAAGVLQRFIEMGIEGFLISSSVIGVVAQRLVRRICEHCRSPYQPPAEELELYHRLSDGKKETFTRGAGCNHCARTGYHGRIGVFEVLRLTDSVKQMVSNKASVHDIRAEATREGMVTMRQDAVAKVDQNLTTLGEVLRSVYVT
jgi:type IV pilus assembly protein PilB